MSTNPHAARAAKTRIRLKIYIMLIIGGVLVMSVLTAIYVREDFGACYVLVSCDPASMAEIWRQFASIFITTAIISMNIHNSPAS